MGRLSIEAEGPGDWGITQRAFQTMLRRLQCATPTVDWFAAPWNAKCSSFVSRVAMQGSMQPDAFAHCWYLPDHLGYICPPHMIIPRVLAKIDADRASCVLVLPAWLMVWHSQLQLLPIVRRC